MTTGGRLPISIDDVRAAADRIAGLAHRTPLLRSRTLDARVGAPVALKAENLQRAGAFKFRGACNAVAALRPEGVCSVSSGNHAQALALAAREHGARATILMPRDAPASKRAATEGYGAEVLEFDRYSEDRDVLVRELAAERGLTLVHPYDEPLVMAGQGTVGLELAAEVEDLDVVLVPCGGGGLLSGVATAIRALRPAARIVGVEPQASDDTARSLRAGERVTVEVRPTIADGQQLPTPGERTWPVIRALVDDVVTVSDAEIVEAMRLLFERMKVVAEPSGATALAALLAGRVEPRTGTVGVVISGGNVGAARFASLVGR
ncbi:MAG: threo-3-hydroxy-L-aspartate ammonia-lyase [Solirubrobacteraceae bacterium]